jgi:hypothetical protein
MAVYLKFNAHCPYRGPYWGRYGEEASPHHVWLINAAQITDIKFPEAATAEYRYDYEHAWGRTVLRTHLDSMSIGLFGFNKATAKQAIRTIEAHKSSRNISRPFGKLAFAGPGLGGGTSIFLSLTDLRGQDRDLQRDEEAGEKPVPQSLSSLPAIERWLKREGHTILDLSSLQRYNLPAAPKPA